MFDIFYYILGFCASRVEVCNGGEEGGAWSRFVRASHSIYSTYKYTYMYSLFCQRCPCGYMLLDFKYQNEAFSDRVGGLRDGGQLQPIFWSVDGTSKSVSLQS